MHHDRSGKSTSKENLSKEIAKFENLADKALKSGDMSAANRNRLMAAVYRSIMERS